MQAVLLFDLILAILIAVSALYWVAEHMGWPPSATLLIGGAGLAFMPGVPPVQLDPELVLVLFLPPLLSDGAWFTEIARFRRHMTGILSSMADHLALGLLTPVVAGMAALVAFLLGAVCSSVMLTFARAHRMHSQYALPLLLEAMLLLCFGSLGATMARVDSTLVSLTVLLLCFMMGLQNAVTSVLSGGDARTTHVTGTMTDIGIELGHLLARAGGHQAEVPTDSARLRKLTRLLLSYFLGGIAGALGFSRLGYAATLPLALILVFLTGIPALDDARALWRRRQPK